MKVLKGIIIGIILIALLLCQFVLLSALACEKTFSKDSIAEAVQGTQVSNAIVDHALENSDLKDNAAGKAMVKAFLGTQAGSEFIGEYASSTLYSILHREPAPKLTQKDINGLVNNGISELSDEAGIGLSGSQKKLISAYVSTNSGDLLIVLNKVLPTQEEIKEASAGQWKTLQNIRILLSPSLKIGIAIAVAILGLFLIFLNWKSKLGLLWWGIISLICGTIFSLSGVSTGFIKQIIQMPSGQENAFILSPLSTMIEQSMSSVGIVSLLLGGLLIVVYFIARLGTKRRKKTR